MFITRFIADLEAIRTPNPTRAPLARTGTSIQRPRAPPATYAKIHVDAGVRTRRGGAAVAVCRGTHGLFLGSSALVIPGIWDPATLEAMACREGIALAEDLNITLCAIV